MILLRFVLQIYQIEINKTDIKLKCVEREIEKQKGYKTNLTKLLEEKKGVRSAVKVPIRALDPVIYTNMNVDDYSLQLDSPSVAH